MSFLTYCSKTWIISTGDEAHKEAAEMRFLRRMLHILWTDNQTNNSIFNRAGTERHLLKTVRRRQAEFLGHVMIKSKLENLVMTGKFDGKKGAMQVDREQAISLA